MNFFCSIKNIKKSRTQYHIIRDEKRGRERDIKMRTACRSWEQKASSVQCLSAPTTSKQKGEVERDLFSRDDDDDDDGLYIYV